MFFVACPDTSSSRSVPFQIPSQFSVKDIETLLTWIYDPRAFPSMPETLMSLAHAAHYFDVPELASTCEQSLCECFDGDKENKLLPDILFLADELHCTKLRGPCTATR